MQAIACWQTLKAKSGTRARMTCTKYGLVTDVVVRYVAAVVEAEVVLARAGE